MVTDGAEGDRGAIGAGYVAANRDDGDVREGKSLRVLVMLPHEESHLILSNLWLVTDIAHALVDAVVGPFLHIWDSFVWCADF